MYDNQSLKRAFGLLEILCDHPGGISVPELSERTGLHRATIHRMLEVLRSMGYVAKTAQHKRYIIGFRMARFGNKELIADRIRLRSARRLRLLANEFGAPVVLGMLRGVNVVVVEEFRPRANKLAPPHPRVAPAHISALGKVLLAYQNPPWLERTLSASSQLNDMEAGESKQVITELELTRRAGMASDSQVLGQDVVTIAVPLVNPAGRATCAVALSWARELLTGETENRAKQRLLKVTSEIVSDLVDQAMQLEPE